MQVEVLDELAPYYTDRLFISSSLSLADFQTPVTLDLESLVIGLIKKRKRDFQQLLPPRKRIHLGTDYEENYYNIPPGPKLHDTIVHVLEEELQKYFHYVEPAPRSYARQFHRERKQPDLLCQHPRESLVVLDDSGTPVELDIFSTVLWEIKSGQSGGARKQLHDYWRRHIGTNRPTARLRFSYQRRALKIYR